MTAPGYDAEGEALPHYLQLLWDIEQPGRRGPRPRHSIREVGQAAVAVADREGLGAASMKAVAAELGMTTMSLYRYVDSKDELEALMLDTAYGAPDPSVTARGRWQVRLTRWARSVAHIYLLHPWSVSVQLSSPPLTPHAIGWMELGLQALAPARLSGQSQLSALLAVDGYVRDHVRSALQFGFTSVRTAGYAPSKDSLLYGQRVAQLIDEQRFPALCAAQDAFSNEDDDFFETELTFGLSLLIGGIEALINREAS